jgi:hypothetical protein
LSLESLLAQKRASILKRWFDLIVATYPAETAKFLKRQEDHFANPIGFSIHQGIEGLLTEVATGIDPERVSPFLDRIIRVRAIQDFTPSRAVSFVPLLKQVIREVLGGKGGKGEQGADPEELALIESRIDELMLLSFDVYMQCREKIYEIKVNEVKRLYCSPHDRRTLVCQVSEPEEKGGDAEKAPEAR